MRDIVARIHKGGLSTNLDLCAFRCVSDQVSDKPWSETRLNMS